MTATTTMPGVHGWFRPLRSWLGTAGGRRVVRYMIVSMMNVVLGEAVLGVSYLFLRWPVWVAAVTAVAVTTVPAYFVNRTWVWGKTGRSHWVKEVIPFWAVAAVYLVLSVAAARAAEVAAQRVTASRPVQTAVIMSAILVASAVLWLVRYFVLDTLIFPHHKLGRPPMDPFARETADARG